MKRAFCRRSFSCFLFPFHCQSTSLSPQTANKIAFVAIKTNERLLLFLWRLFRECNWSRIFSFHVVQRGRGGEGGICERFNERILSKRGSLIYSYTVYDLKLSNQLNIHELFNRILFFFTTFNSDSLENCAEVENDLVPGKDGILWGWTICYGGWWVGFEGKWNWKEQKR